MEARARPASQGAPEASTLSCECVSWPTQEGCRPFDRSGYASHIAPVTNSDDHLLEPILASRPCLKELNQTTALLEVSKGDLEWIADRTSDKSRLMVEDNYFAKTDDFHKLQDLIHQIVVRARTRST